MSQPAYVYRIFDNASSSGQVLEDLHKAGFKSADLSVVGKDCPEFRNQSAKIRVPWLVTSFATGSSALCGGLWAGVTMAPQIHTLASSKSSLQ